ncbi:hypothetical protein pdam_00014642 [Pocillopora damicornis]|uniref:Uncharacterized protein n=1 Tax=Pocillopora damicornis TaxID=46731 RepID=A0A3M6TLV3_POCDA|nr:hypothetical protein pdam_00014642 [Pocillopora damicornis]
MVKFKERSYLSKLGYSLKDNPCKFWSYYKAITKTTKIPGVMKNESVQATRPIDQANLFNVSTATCLPRLDYNIKCELSKLRLSLSNILKQLQSLDVHKASLGPPPKLLQKSMCQ